MAETDAIVWSGVVMAKDSPQGTFTEFLKSIAPEHRPICKALRDLVKKAHGDFVEIVWMGQRIASYGVGSKKMSEHYVYIAPHKNHVNFGFYHGALLKDPAGLLEGTGKRLRHVKLTSAAEAKSASVKKLLTAAIADRKSACG